jgi:hypothetical protein
MADGGGELRVEEERPPDWVRDAVRHTVEELVLFSRTLWGITVRPMAFARAWAEGRERALNPLAFLATAASIVAAWKPILGWLGYGENEDASFVRQVILAVGPFVPYAAVGALAHLLMLGSRPRRRLADAIAIGLYAGGPALVGYCLILVGVTVHWMLIGSPHVEDGLINAMSPRANAAWRAAGWLVVAAFVRSFWLGLAGLHRGRWVAAGAATLLAVVALAFALGAHHESGPFGFQPVIEHTPYGWDYGVHD